MNLPKHDRGLFLNHNEHKGYYQLAGNWLKEIEQREVSPSWKSDEQRARALCNDEVWTLQWYPNTPMAFHYIAAPTLDELLEFAAYLETLK